MWGNDKADELATEAGLGGTIVILRASWPVLAITIPLAKRVLPQSRVSRIVSSEIRDFRWRGRAVLRGVGKAIPYGARLALYRFDIRARDRDCLAVVAGDLSDAYLDFALE
jgi:hypothetical protein